MRYLLAAAFLLTACTNAPNAQNVANDELAIDQAIDALHTAQMQILQLQAEIAAMRAVLPQVPDGGAPAAVKQVYLVANAGTPSERVIGLGAPGSQCAMSLEFNGEVCPLQFDGISFDEPNCQGRAYAGFPVRLGPMLHTHDGAIYAPVADAETVTVQSARSPAGDCIADVATEPLVPVMQIGSLPVYDASALSLIIR